LNKVIEEQHHLIGVFLGWQLHNTPPNNSRTHVLTSACGTFAKMEHILGYKTNTKKNKNLEALQSMFSANNNFRLEIVNKKMTRKSQKESPWKLNDTFQSNPWIKEAVSWEMKYFQMREMEIKHVKNFRIILTRIMLWISSIGLRANIRKGGPLKVII
jgi:hypothetical protein